MPGANFAEISIDLLCGLSRCQGVSRNARCGVHFSAHIRDPRALGRVRRETIHRIPAFAVWTAEIIELGLRETYSRL